MSYVDALRSRVRFGKFVSVGVVGALCDTAVLVTLTQLGVLPEVATLVGVEMAILVMFGINDRWTFAGHEAADGRSLLERLGRSHGVRAAGSLTQFLVFVAVFRGVPISVPVVGVNLWLLVAKGSGVGVGMVVNYVFESLLTWRVHYNCPPEPGEVIVFLNRCYPSYYEQDRAAGQRYSPAPGSSGFGLSNPSR